MATLCCALLELSRSILKRDRREIQRLTITGRGGVMRSATPYPHAWQLTKAAQQPWSRRVFVRRDQHIIIRQPNAARGNVAAYGFRLVGSVDAVKRVLFTCQRYSARAPRGFSGPRASRSHFVAGPSIVLVQACVEASPRAGTSRATLVCFECWPHPTRRNPPRRHRYHTAGLVRLFGPGRENGFADRRQWYRPPRVCRI